MSYTKEQNKEYLQKYFKTEHGVIKRLFHHMKERSKVNKWDFSLTFDVFKEWVYQNNFKELYDYWVSYDHLKSLKPSVDRINDMGFYELSNMRLITWFDNWDRGQKSCKNRHAYEKSFSLYRESLKYPLFCVKEDIIYLFKDMDEVLDMFPFMLKSKISMVVNGKRKHHHGYSFFKINKGVVAR